MIMRIIASLSCFLGLILTACSASVAQTQTAPKIVVDQFGYLPELEKRAVIRDPKQGYDAHESFQPGARYGVIDTRTGKTVFEGRPEQWKRGQVDSVSGDRVWWFDFSPVDVMSFAICNKALIVLNLKLETAFIHPF